jgi:mRNA-degrading endonuclease RelE of RelBE toxin-antitoxin system
MGYRLLIDREVVDFLQSLGASRRRDLLRHFKEIERFPSAHSDYRDKDAEDRPVDVSIHDGLAIYYWIDEADRQVKILELIVADRRDKA